jgi:DNA primase
MDKNLIYRTKFVDLVAIVESDLGTGKRSGRWLMFTCPFHEDRKPSLAVINSDDSSGSHWYCLGCGKKGDAIDWLMEYQGKTFQEAIEELTNGSLGASKNSPSRRSVDADTVGRLEEAWVNRAWKLVDRAAAALWNWKEKALFVETDPETGKQVSLKMTPLDWLFHRGLKENTIRTWRLGYIPFSWYDKSHHWGLNTKPIYIPKGVLIPAFTSPERLYYLKIRLPDASPCKYLQISGGKQALFMAQTLLEGHDTAVFCEGEFDALLCWQEAGDLAGFVSLGGASKQLTDVFDWGLYLLRTPKRLLIYDSDEAGQSGVYNLTWLGNSRVVQVPRIREHDRDITDLYKSGGALRAWLEKEIEETSNLYHGKGV